MNLETLLTTPKLVEQAPSVESIRDRAQLILPRPIKLFYGETYDEKGPPIDSMKYYFFVSLLADSLRREGISVDASILIADIAACRNVGDDHRDYYMRLGTERAQFVENVNKIYNTDLKVFKMSEYIDSPEFIAERKKIMDICQSDQELMAAVEKSVPESKVEIERKKNFLYSFDEITTILDLDVKVGPPREDLYDNIARRIASERGHQGPMSLFLTPTFPLGMNWAYFFVNEGIEDHGITAYKAGSKRLQRNRVIIGKSDPDYIRGLIEDSFISTKSELPNVVLDLGIICEMARRKLDRNDSDITLTAEFYTGRISAAQLKEKVGKDLEDLFFSRF